jgi:hypothetical protein
MTSSHFDTRRLFNDEKSIACKSSSIFLYFLPNMLDHLIRNPTTFLIVLRLISMLSEADFREARGVLRGMDQTRRQTADERALDIIHSQNSSMLQVEASSTLFNASVKTYRNNR